MLALPENIGEKFDISIDCTEFILVERKRERERIKIKQSMQEVI
jgi:hypothetical protein